MRLRKNFKKKMQQKKLQSCHLIKVVVPVHSLLPNITYIRKSTNTIKRGRRYHKTIAVNFTSRFLRIGDDQWPHANKISHNAHNMRHTQVTCHYNLSQSGAKDILSRISAFFSRLTLKFVMASPSKLPNTLKPVRCKQRLNKRKSKFG